MNKLKNRLKVIFVIEIIVIILTWIISAFKGSTSRTSMSNNFFYVASVQLLIGAILGLGTNKTIRLFANLFRPNFTSYLKNAQKDSNNLSDVKNIIPIFITSGSITLIISIILGFLSS